MNKKIVAVIGAGASGLAAIKCCLDEGLDTVCFERTGEIGGLWNFTECVRDSQACVMRSTVINACKESMAYSDFPIPKEYPNFMHNSKVLKYFDMYADHFSLKKYIRFQSEVHYIKKASDFATTGQWVIEVNNRETGKTQTLTFDAVLICTGHHAEPNIPLFLGLDKFKGKVIHSHDYKDSRGFEGKRIVVVGIGNSGADLSVELSRVASQVYLSTRRGSWIINRVMDNGLPISMVEFTRNQIFMMQHSLGLYPSSFSPEKLNKRFDHRLYCLEPNFHIFSAHPTVCDELPNRIICGSVQVRPNIQEFMENGVKFDDGTFEDSIDAVIFATGYVFGFPFLDKSVIDVKENKIELYKYMFPPDLENMTLAVIGCIQPLGAVMPISELQSRLATRVFKGLITLPSRDKMWKDIQAKQALMELRYVKSTRHTIQVDFVPFMDELAAIVGCKPNFWKMWLTDPRLAWNCIFGPASPYQWRLEGPGKWDGAKEAIYTQWDRTYCPLKTRSLNHKPVESKVKMYFLLAIGVIGIGLLISCISLYQHDV